MKLIDAERLEKDGASIRVLIADNTFYYVGLRNYLLCEKQQCSCMGNTNYCFIDY